MRPASPVVFLVPWIAAAAAAACSPDTKDYWASLGPDGGGDDASTDADADSDTDADTDTDTDECEEDGGIACGDGGDTDTWDGSYCDTPEYQEFLDAAVHPFDNSAAPELGNTADPDVVITTFSYFYCPHCATSGELIQELLSDPSYGDRTAYYFRNYVYDMNPPSFGCTAHRAGWSAHQQGLFWEMHDAIFGAVEVTLSEEDLFALAAGVGCDMDLFAQDYDAVATLEALQLDKDVGLDAGVSGTPSIYVDGKPIEAWTAVPYVLDCLLGYAD